jgi:N-acetylglutamate synthase-like GNAT family acetyltransferase
MAVLLKNLVARSPQTEDLEAITELVTACEDGEQSAVGRSLEDVLSRWQRPDFHLANDARVIVTTEGRIVGFACVWHEHHVQISTFLCVHPAYRQRGIGTLLLRLVEVRARQHISLAPAGERVVLRGVISKASTGAQSLFVQEGYAAGRQFLRLSFFLAEDSGAQPAAGGGQKLTVDIGLEQGRLIGADVQDGRDGLCSVGIYRIYEKELRPATPTHEQGANLGALGCC